MKSSGHPTSTKKSRRSNTRIGIICVSIFPCLWEDIGTQVLLSGKYASAADFSKAIDAVKADQVLEQHTGDKHGTEEICGLILCADSSTMLQTWKACALFPFKGLFLECGVGVVVRALQLAAAAKKLLASKPTVVAYGDTHALPHYAKIEAASASCYGPCIVVEILILFELEAALSGKP
eukprot:3845196-Amphidinium_carterae.1